MSFATRMTQTLIFALATVSGALAQETTTTPASAASDPTATAPAATESTTTTELGRPAEKTEREPLSSYELRNQFSSVLRRHPHEVATIFALDPTLLSNDTYLEGYPAVAEFLREHPEIRRNPRFFLAEFGQQQQRHESTLDELIESIAIVAVFVSIAFVLSWIIRTIIEQKRWNRLSRTQSEVHNKILDRFGSSDELLAYIKTPAGAKFLESAPIPLHTERPAANTPWSRPMWSVQIGIIVASAGVGMMLVSIGLDKDAAQAFFSLGVIAFCTGAGFITSAAVSIVLSRRLASWQEPITPADSLRD